MLNFHFPFNRFNYKSKQQDKKILTQGLELPNSSQTTRKTPAALSKPSVLPTPPSSVGWPRLRTGRYLPSPNPAVSFQLVTGPGNTSVLIPSSVPPACVTSTSQGGMKQKGEEVRTTATEAKKLKRCGKCGEKRTPPAHQQYMEYRYCSSVDKTPLTEWREQLKNAGVARKKKGN
ncbi:uncharacterized protein LOC128174232 [Crassostrea angulata]|uniref:uncharacterized protein LOC128174232 n=1 Tax=Magallana angulata TaxID=2784310 RepID=UPI0022B1D024|nr:uncharacterized protein LOC128174232 [Crassostrea angulata]